MPRSGGGSNDSPAVFSWQQQSILGVIPNWLKRSGNRSKVVIVTKVGMEISPGEKGPWRAYILRAGERLFQRLQKAYIDLYQSHIDYEGTLLGFIHSRPGGDHQPTESTPGPEETAPLDHRRATGNRLRTVPRKKSGIPSWLAGASTSPVKMLR